jgi:ribonuclease P protein component
MDKVRNTFTREERLRSRKQIRALFEKGQSFYKYPFKVIFLNSTSVDESPVKLMVSVSRKNFKRAVDRNRIKRLIREGYRKNKSALYASRTGLDYQLHIALIYTGKTIMDYDEIERKIILILQRLIEQDEQAAG